MKTTQLLAVLALPLAALGLLAVCGLSASTSAAASQPAATPGSTPLVASPTPSLQAGDVWRSYSTTGVRALAVDQADHIWVGTAFGLSEFDGQTWKSHDVPTNRQAFGQVNALAVDKAGNIWASTGSYYGALSRFDGQTWTIYPTADNFKNTAIAADQAGHVWVGTGPDWVRTKGVNCFDGTNWITYTVKNGLSHNYVNAIAADRQGVVWFGTADGVSAYDGRAWITYTTQAGLAHKWVNAVAVDPSGGRVWFGTGGGGVSAFDGHTWTTYTAADGLASNVIYALAVDRQGQVWVGTYGGVSKYDGRAWTTYTTADGLTSNRVSALAVDGKGHLWVGTDRGLNEIDAGHGQPPVPAVSLAMAVEVTFIQPITLEIGGPRLVDDTAERIYAQGKVNGRAKTLVLDRLDERLVATYDLIGNLGLDKEHGWLYIDQKDKGLAVVNIRTEHLQTFIPLPQNQYNISSASPQADPATGRVIAFRDNVAYIADPATGSIVDTLAADLTEIYTNMGPGSEVPNPIRWADYDPTKRILYAAMLSGYSTSSMPSPPSYMIVSYDLASHVEIARTEFSVPGPSDGEVLGDYLYYSYSYRVGGYYGAERRTWREGRPWVTSEGWLDGGSPMAWDPARRLFYEVTDSALRVFDAETMGMTMHLSRPLTGTFEGYDGATDSLLFRQNSRLQAWPLSALRPPAPEPLTASATPTAAVRLVAVSPGWSADRTLLAVWDDPALSEKATTEFLNWDNPQGPCVVNALKGQLLYVSRNSGQTWSRPLGGLRGSCERFTTLAVSPAYTRDQTLLAGVHGLGIFKSTDGGQLWQPSGTGLAHMHITEIALSPGFEQDQTAFAFDERGNLYRSRDKGQSWQPLDNWPWLDLQSFRVVLYPQFALSPDFERDHTLIGWRRRYDEVASKKAETSIYVDELYISRDKGDTWKLAGNLPAETGLVSVAPLFDKWQTLFAYAWDPGQKHGELSRSTDAGRTWTAVLTTTAQTAQPLVYGPDEEARSIFLLAGDRVYRSGDGGQTWAEFALPSGMAPTALAISPDYARDGLLFVGTQDGRVVEVKGGGK